MCNVPCQWHGEVTRTLPITLVIFYLFLRKNARVWSLISSMWGGVSYHCTNNGSAEAMDLIIADSYEKNLHVGVRYHVMIMWVSFWAASNSKLMPSSNGRIIVPALYHCHCKGLPTICRIGVWSDYIFKRVGKRFSCNHGGALPNYHIEWTEIWHMWGLPFLHVII